MTEQEAISVQQYSFKNGFDRLEQALRNRLAISLQGETPEARILDVSPYPEYLEQFVVRYNLNNQEVIVLLLAMVAHVSPGFLSDIITDYLPNGGDFPEFGGIKGKQHRGILPTGETALYILYGTDVDARVKGMAQLGQSTLFREYLVSLRTTEIGEPKWSGRLVIDEGCLSEVLYGKTVKPELSQDFPARLITTGLHWDDLILKQKTIDEIKEIEVWLQYNEVLMNDWQMKHKVKPGYRVMFYGPPGTGKTLTAGLLGKYTNKDVYRIDLSMVVSKYIGETEKNLSKLFDKAMNKDWILFFDEADAIFGKRTNVRDAHDKYANQEVSYLLQRIEAHPGLVILASNFKNNIDTAFTRRFQTIIEFEAPTYKERLQLWKNNLPTHVTLEKELSLEVLAKKFALTGANIVNIIQYACLKTIAAGSTTISRKHLQEGIKKEYLKEGKTVSL